MVRPAGLFDNFDNLDQISPEAIINQIKPVPHIIALENYLANKILYPQALACTQYDTSLDLAILREALKTNNKPFVNITLRKILIPVKFLSLFPDLTSLSRVFVDALLMNRKKENNFPDIWTIVLTMENNTEEIIGSVLLPQFAGKESAMNLKVQEKTYNIRSGASLVIPCLKNRCEIAYQLTNGSFLGKSESAVEVYGGKLGIMIDGRSL